MSDSAAKWIAGAIVLLSIGYSVSVGLTPANPLVGLIAGVFSGTPFGLAVASLVLLAIGVFHSPLTDALFKETPIYEQSAMRILRKHQESFDAAGLAGH
jgi:hypothetical protein